MIRFIPSAYIIIQNVGLTKPKIGKFEIPDWVIVHDDTEREFVKWTADNPLFPTRQSYEEARIVQGLQDDDWVHDILLRYLIDYDFSTLVEVRKIKSCLKTAKEDSIVDMVKSFFPEFSPIPQPSYSAAQAFIF